MNEFENSLEHLGILYEEGKDCLHSMNHLFPIGHPEEREYLRLYEILVELRDLSAINMKKLHFKNPN